MYIYIYIYIHAYIYAYIIMIYNIYTNNADIDISVVHLSSSVFHPYLFNIYIKFVKSTSCSIQYIPSNFPTFPTKPVTRKGIYAEKTISRDSMNLIKHIIESIQDSAHEVHMYLIFFHLTTHSHKKSYGILKKVAKVENFYELLK